MTSNSSVWSKNAKVRFNQITSGKDISMTEVIEPAMLNIISRLDFKNIADVGSGIGHFTSLLQRYGVPILGIEPSRESVKLARQYYSSEYVSFYNSTIEKFSNNHNSTFSLITANMVLMNVDNLEDFLDAIADMQESGDKLLVSMIHPAFWAVYKNYDNRELIYHETKKIAEPFQISLDKKREITSYHYHRPLSRYINELSERGYYLSEMHELLPDEKIQDRYPNKWQFPRFIIMLFKKSSK